MSSIKSDLVRPVGRKFGVGAVADAEEVLRKISEGKLRTGRCRGSRHGQNGEERASLGRRDLWNCSMHHAICEFSFRRFLTHSGPLPLPNC